MNLVKLYLLIIAPFTKCLYHRSICFIQSLDLKPSFADSKNDSKRVVSDLCLKYGLSYTTFGYSNLSVKSSGNRTYQVSFNVKNTGSREGADVPQIYVGDSHSKVPRPLKELKGFSKVSLRSGETKTVSIILDERCFSYFDVSANRWRAEPGDFDVLVGHSSGQIELHGKLSF